MGSYGKCFTIALALSTASCISGAIPSHRLYPPTKRPLRTEEVSTLSGYVRFVDGEDVSSFGSQFELLPGCHVIGTPSSWGRTTYGGNSVVNATTGKWIFALPMKAGHQYSIEVIVGAMTGPTGSLTIKGFETDLAGNKTREFVHATSPKDVEACIEEAAQFTLR